jgi:hypothetical protein
MVKMNRKGKSGSWRNMGTIVVGSVGILTLTAFYNNTSLASVFESRQATSIALDTDQNAAEVKTRRKHIEQKCYEAKNVQDVDAIRRINKIGFALPVKRTEQPRDERAIKRCRHVVLDFGSNIGDTAGKAIDAGLLGCKREDLKTEVMGPVFNTESRQIEEPQKGRNPLVLGFEHLMKGFGPLTGPEDYCYYGVEGNPVFTDRLQSLEDFIMDARPRPLQHVHFFTQSVGAGEDGMTKLYLDTINKGVNYWGSSIFTGHPDVKNSALAQNVSVETLATDVMGYTIGTLMRQTLIAFDPAATPEDQKGGHMIMKVDIEGGEYPLFKQAADEGTLCEYVKMGNQADLYIEFHPQSITGKNEDTTVYGRKLGDCGVSFHNLPAVWA